MGRGSALEAAAWISAATLLAFLGLRPVDLGGGVVSCSMCALTLRIGFGLGATVNESSGFAAFAAAFPFVAAFALGEAFVVALVAAFAVLLLMRCSSRTPCPASDRRRGRAA